jgi:ribosomal protein S18 acetylase RimI-like enzyme
VSRLPDIIIRPATSGDAAPIAAIHAASWRDAYANILAPEFLSGGIDADRLAVWSHRLHHRSPTQQISVACDSSGLLQAFICSYCDFDPVWGSLIDNLHVHPRARGQGIGERLFRDTASQLLKKASSPGLHLWVFEANEAGLRFYKRLGGRAAGKENSTIPAAEGKAVLRIHWPAIAQIDQAATAAPSSCRP